jgi:regulatory protein
MFCGASFIIKNMEDIQRISAVEPQKRKKDRYNIYADGEYIASLGAEAIVVYGVKPGAEIAAAVLREAVEKDNAAYAFDCAAAILAHGMRTRADLTRKLGERGLGEGAVCAALDKLESYGYVNDAAYAAEYVRTMRETGTLGRMAVEYKLREKGVAASVAAEAMEDYTEEDERDNARRQLARLARGGDIREERRRISAALVRHGFAYDVISSLFSEDRE